MIIDLEHQLQSQFSKSGGTVLRLSSGSLTDLLLISYLLSYLLSLNLSLSLLLTLSYFLSPLCLSKLSLSALCSCSTKSSLPSWHIFQLYQGNFLSCPKVLSLRPMLKASPEGLKELNCCDSYSRYIRPLGTALALSGSLSVSLSY